MGASTTRRGFLQQAAGVAAAATLADRVLTGTSEASPTGVPTRELGRTGERVSILCLGGWHAAVSEDRKESVRLIQTAVDEGITFLDNAWEYHDGAAEEVMGEALAMDGYRKRAFLMTKVCARDREGAKKNLEDSLRRLRTDVIDLWQFHELSYDNDPDWVFEKGAIKAALEARKEGKVRFIGFTGHKDPRIHRRMLDKPFEWDAVQMPINVFDAAYRSFQKGVLPTCLERGIGVVGMKGLGGGGTGPGVALRSGLSVAECWRYALSLPVSSQVVGLTNLEQLKEALAVVRPFQPLADSEKTALLDRMAEVSGDGRFELFKSTTTFDGGTHRTQHGFPPRRRS